MNERVRALQREAERLAGEARTLVGDLRKLEVERDLQAERVDAGRGRGRRRRRLSCSRRRERLAQLEQQRAAQLPDLKAQLVDLYKRGRGGYARLLLEADGVRELGRTTRAVAALVRINEQRVADHRRTLESLRAERAALEQKTAELQTNARPTRGRRAPRRSGRSPRGPRSSRRSIDGATSTRSSPASCRWPTSACSSRSRT